MKAIQTAIPDVLLLEPRVFSDHRGAFFESYNAREFGKLGVQAEFVQDNQSVSHRGVLRGLHYQLRQPQGKLVRVVSGAIFDVAVDLRQSSDTFGRWVGYELSAQNGRMLWIPPGFAHGFAALEDGTVTLYKATDFYLPGDERCVLWNDPQIAVKWPLSGDPILSDKDTQGLRFSQAEVYEYEFAVRP